MNPIDFAKSCTHDSFIRDFVYMVNITQINSNEEYLTEIVYDYNLIGMACHRLMECILEDKTRSKKMDKLDEDFAETLNLYINYLDKKTTEALVDLMDHGGLSDYFNINVRITGHTIYSGGEP
jgi:hypothetical protein